MMGYFEKSRRFDIKANPDDLKAVLGCVQYMLEKSVSVGSPHMAPKKGEPDTEGEDPLGLDDNEYVTASGGDDDFEDEV